MNPRGYACGGSPIAVRRSTLSTRLRLKTSIPLSTKQLVTTLGLSWGPSLRLSGDHPLLFATCCTDKPVVYRYVLDSLDQLGEQVGLRQQGELDLPEEYFKAG